MDVTGISTSLGLSDLQTSSTKQADIEALDKGKPPDETPNNDGRGRRGRRGRALGVFRQELRFALNAHFHAKFMVAQKAYAQFQPPETPEDIANETLGAATRIAEETPTKAAESIIRFRTKVHETATYVRETVGVGDDVADVDEVVAKVDEGLDAIETDVANNRLSSATALSVDTQSKQRSSILIRTQEGDVVKFDLRRMDTMSASNIALADGDTFASVTEVDFSSRLRLMLHVKGDLNDSELAAILNVFSQAEEIANEFFDGDISAAFGAAQSFEFNAEQLARVNMRFRMHQVSNVFYAETVNTPEVAAPIALDNPVVTPAATAVPAEPAAAVESTVEPIVPTPVAQTPVDDTQVSETPVATPADPSALSDFFELLSDFLRSVSNGFDLDSGNGSFRYFYSESFKLEILKAVIHTAAPAESTDTAANVEQLIDSINANETLDAKSPQ